MIRSKLWNGFSVGRMLISNRDSSLRYVRFSICECWYFAKCVEPSFHSPQLCLLMFCSKLWYDFSAGRMPISNRGSSLRNVRFSISECWYFVRSRTDHTQVFQSRLLIFKQCVWIERARVNFVHDDRMTIAHFAEIVDRSFYYVRLCLSMLCSKLWNDFCVVRMPISDQESSLRNVRSTIC